MTDITCALLHWLTPDKPGDEIGLRIVRPEASLTIFGFSFLLDLDSLRALPSWGAL